MKQAREILGSGFLQEAPPEPKPALSTGSKALDRLIGGKEKACDGYPGGRVVQVCIPADSFNTIRTILLRTWKGPATVMFSPEPLPVFAGFDDPPQMEKPPKVVTAQDGHQKMIADLWLTVSQKQAPRLVVVPDVQSGLTGDEGRWATAQWSAFLPKAKARNSRMGHTILAFSKLVPNINYNAEELVGSPVVAQGGEAWRFYSALCMGVQFSEADPGALIATLWKNKCSSTQGRSMLLAVRDGEINDGDTVKLLSSVFGTPFNTPDDAFDHVLEEGLPVPR